MKLWTTAIFLVFAFAIALTAQAATQTGLIEVLERDGSVVKGSSNMSAIYRELLNKGFENQVGHTMAAAMLATCRPNDAADVIAKDLYEMLGAMSRSRHPVIFSANPRRDARISYAAATLTCIRGTKSAAEMVTKLDVVYSAVVADGFTDWLPNVVVAAQLTSSGTTVAAAETITTPAPTETNGEFKQKAEPKVVPPPPTPSLK